MPLYQLFFKLFMISIVAIACCQNQKSAFFIIFAAAAFGIIPGASKMHCIVFYPIHHIGRARILFDAAAFTPFIMLDPFSLNQQESSVFILFHYLPPKYLDSLFAIISFHAPMSSTSLAAKIVKKNIFRLDAQIIQHF